MSVRQVAVVGGLALLCLLSVAWVPLASSPPQVHNLAPRPDLVDQDYVEVWQPTSSIGAPAGRYAHTAVWSGSEMLM